MNAEIKVGTRVRRAGRFGKVFAYSPEYKACIMVLWDDGVHEGWFDINGTDGTENKEKHIQILHDKRKGGCKKRKIQR